MTASQMEERLRALAEQRTALLEGMRDKLPDKFDPLKFDLQEERTLQPIEEKKSTAEESIPEIAKPVSPKREVVTPLKFSPGARPSRMSGVHEIRKSDYDTLLGQGQLVSPGSITASKAKPKGRSSSAKPKTAAPRANSASAKVSPRNVSPLNKLSPGSALSTGLRSASPPQLGASRPVQQGASTSQQNRRPVSGSPSRSRAAAYGQDLSTPRGRASKDYDVIKERRMGKSGSGNQTLWK